MPIVSIITPTYNSSRFILITYNSICKQSLGDWEWLVTDDASSDNTSKILQEISSQDNRVKLFQNKVNSGAAVSRNNSLAFARGDFIAFLDSDDLWYPKKLEKQIDFMNIHGANFSFTEYELIDELGHRLGLRVDNGVSGTFSYEDQLKKKSVMGCSTVMLRANKFKNLSMPLLRTRQDYAFWLKLLKKGEKAYLLNDLLTQYRLSPNSISRNKFKAALSTWHVYRTIEGLSLPKAFNCFFSYALSALFRR